MQGMDLQDRSPVPRAPPVAEPCCGAAVQSANLAWHLRAAISLSTPRQLGVHESSSLEAGCHLLCSSGSPRATRSLYEIGSAACYAIWQPPSLRITRQDPDQNEVWRGRQSNFCQKKAFCSCLGENLGSWTILSCQRCVCCQRRCQDRGASTQFRTPSMWISLRADDADSEIAVSAVDLWPSSRTRAPSDGLPA